MWRMMCMCMWMCVCVCAYVHAWAAHFSEKEGEPGDRCHALSIANEHQWTINKQYLCPMSFTTKGGSNSLPFAGSRKVSPKCNTGPRPQMQSLAPAVPMAIQGCPFFQVEHAKIQNQSCLRLESKKSRVKISSREISGIGKVDVITAYQ